MTAIDRGCVKTHAYPFFCTRQGQQIASGSILSNFVDQESAEFKSGKLIYGFHTASTRCSRLRPSVLRRSPLRNWQNLGNRPIGLMYYKRSRQHASVATTSIQKVITASRKPRRRGPPETKQRARSSENLNPCDTWYLARICYRA